jgi:hypothetical protein
VSDVRETARLLRGTFSTGPSSGVNIIEARMNIAYHWRRLHTVRVEWISLKQAIAWLKLEWIYHWRRLHTVRVEWISLKLEWTYHWRRLHTVRTRNILCWSYVAYFTCIYIETSRNAQFTSWGWGRTTRLFSANMGERISLDLNRPTCWHQIRSSDIGFSWQRSHFALIRFVKIKRFTVKKVSWSVDAFNHLYHSCLGVPIN